MPSLTIYTGDRTFFVTSEFGDTHRAPEGLPRGYSGKEATCHYGRGKRHEFDSWVRKVSGAGMVTHSSFLARKVPWTEEAGGRLQSMGS